MLRLLGFLLLLALVFVAVGFFRGWFEYSTVEGGSGTRVSISVDTDKMRADTAKAADKLAVLSGKAKEAFERLRSKASAGEQVVAGHLVRVDASARRLEVRSTEGTTTPYAIGGAAEVLLNGEAVTLADLRADDEIALVVTSGGAVTRVAATRE